MTHCIEHVKQSEVNMLRDLCMTTFRTTFEEGEYSDEDFKHYFNEAYAVEQLKKELLNKNSFTYFYKENNKVIGYFKLNINEAQTEAMGNMKTSNTLIRIDFVIESDDHLIVRKRTLFICD